MFINKYAPTTFDDFLHHTYIKDLINSHISHNNIPNIILSGPPGTGKSVFINILLKKIYNNNKNMYIEINGATEKGINFVREKIKEFIKYKPFKSSSVPFKLIVIDCADQLSIDSQFALRRIIEINSHSTRFCLICDILNNIDTALQSRCIILQFSNIPFSIQLNKLIQICKLENIPYSNAALENIIHLSDNNLCKSINNLQMISIMKNNILEVEISDILSNNDSLNNKTIAQLILFNDIFYFIDNIITIKNNNNISLLDILMSFFNFILFINDIDNQNNYNYLFNDSKNLLTVYNHSNIFEIIEKLADFEFKLKISNIDQKNEILCLYTLCSIIYL